MLGQYVKIEMCMGSGSRVAAERCGKAEE